jgi:hypothetical protein
MYGSTTVSNGFPEKPLKWLRAFLLGFLVTSLKRGANEMMNPAPQDNSRRLLTTL